MIAAVALAVAARRRLRNSSRGVAMRSTDASGAHGSARAPDPNWWARLGTRVPSLIRRRPVGTFLLLAFAGMWIPLIATLAIGLPLRLTSAAGAILGLAVPALLVTGVTQGRPAVTSLLRRSLVPTPRPLAFAVALAAIPATTVALSLVLTASAAPSATEVAHAATRFAIDLVIALLTIQIAEEVGWTGLAQEVLQQRHGALRAAALVAPAFAAIHLPTYLVGAPVTPTAVAGALVQLLPITLFAVAFRVLIAWSYNASRGCVLAAAVTHASFNTTSGEQFLHHLGSGPMLAFLPLIAVALLAVAVTAAGRGSPRRATPPPDGGAVAAGANRRRRPAPLITMELLGVAAMRALLDGDLAEASRICRRQLPSFFLEEAWLWKIRVNQIRTSPVDASWLVRVVVLEPSGVVIGHAGFHGRPDTAGAVEIGYTVAPEHRGNGYAHAVLAALVEEARTHPEVNVVRATISPDNDASLAVIRKGRFVHVGEQWDDVDGLELVFEKDVPARAHDA